MTLQFKAISIRLAVSGLILLSLLLAAFSFTAQAGAATTLAAAPVAPASAATITFYDPTGSAPPISIPLNSYSSEAENPVSLNSASPTGFSGEKLKLTGMTVTWPANSNSPVLYKRMAQGSYFSNANIVFMDQATGKPAYTIGLGRVYFTNITQDQTFGGGIEETVTLFYGEEAHLYPGGVVQCWSVITNTANCPNVKLP